MARFCIVDLGCRVNKYESDCVSEKLCANGFERVKSGDECDICIINTCTVTQESDRKSCQMIRRMIKSHPHAFVIAMGCAAQNGYDKLKNIKGLDCIIGNRKKLMCEDLAKEFIKNKKKNDECKIFVEDVNSLPFEKMSICRAERTRAYIKIEDGCENRCTYCAIPNARGKISSKPKSDIISEVSALCENGWKEVVLTGIETASWGRDLEDGDLVGLISEVSKIDKLERIRLGSLYPTYIDDGFAKEFSQNKKLMPHFHISVQSGSDDVLRAMGRRYTSSDVLKIMNDLRKINPDVQFSCDLLTGFPGESDENFSQTLEFLKAARFYHVHQFPYSIRENTVAAMMKDQIPSDIKRRRFDTVSALCEKIKADIQDEYIKNGTEFSMLCESKKCGVFCGHSDNFIECFIESDEDLRGKILRVKLDRRVGDKVFAKITEA